MKYQTLIVLAAILAVSAQALAQDVATDTDKAAKQVGHTTKVVTKDAAHGTTKAVDKSASTTDHVTKKVAKGLTRGVKGAGHGVKKTATTAADAVK